MATLVANLSDRVDAQTATLAKLGGTAAEARQAAFATRAQFDSGKLAAEGSADLGGALLPRLRELVGSVERLDHWGEEQTAFGWLQGQLADFSRDLRHARERAALWRTRGLCMDLAALLLITALVLLAPRLLAAHPTGCHLIGGTWRDLTDYGAGLSCRYDRP